MVTTIMVATITIIVSIVQHWSDQQQLYSKAETPGCYHSDPDDMLQISNYACVMIRGCFKHKVGCFLVRAVAAEIVGQIGTPGCYHSDSYDTLQISKGAKGGLFLAQLWHPSTDH